MTEAERKALVEELRLAVAKDICSRLRGFLVLVAWIAAICCVVMYFALGR